MTAFPSHPIELNKMFKKTGFYVINSDSEDAEFMIKIHASKVKHKSDLENAFGIVEIRANEFGFKLSLKKMNSDFSDFRFHGSYYNVYFNVLTDQLVGAV